MSARLKLKHMKHRITMIEAENNHLHYELSRLSRDWELIGAHTKLDLMPFSTAPKPYLASVVSHLAWALVKKMCENLDKCITQRLPDYEHLGGSILDVRVLAPKFTETSVDVTIR